MEFLKYEISFLNPHENISSYFNILVEEKIKVLEKAHNSCGGYAHKHWVMPLAFHTHERILVF